MSSGPSGRSPFLGRNRRRTLSQSHPHSGADTSTNANNNISAISNNDDSINMSLSLSLSTPGLLSQGGRLSPAAAAGWSPANSHAIAANRSRRRFFDSSEKRGVLQPPTLIGIDGGVLGTSIPPASVASSNKNNRFTNSHTDISNNTNSNKTLEDDSNTSNHNNATLIVDGIDLNQLRSLAMDAQGNHSVTASPSMAVFYASILYAKTLQPQDAFLYAQALYQNGEFRRSVRLLEKAGLLNKTNNTIHTGSNIEAILLATQSLASLADWEEVLRVLEDVTSSLEDGDNAGWDALAAVSIVEQPHANNTNNNNTTSIHPVARLCLIRGKAYNETSHPTRAAIFWKRALLIDSRCVEALDAMLGRDVITSQDAYDLVSKLHFDPGTEWLRHIYLARLDLPQDTTVQKENKEPNVSFFGGGGAADASTIQMSTPSMMMQTSATKSMLHADNLFDEKEDNRKLLAKSTTTATSQQHHRQLSSTAPPLESNQAAICKNVDAAFDKLWTEHKLHQSPEVLSLAAIRAYRRYNLPAALSYCQALAEMDPLHPAASFVHVATLVGLGHKRVLFRLAHEWVDATPKSARAWFAVGSYYYACGRYHVAQRHFCRATRIDPQCPEAWIAFGCAFAACDESDQALASFRAAQRLAPAQHASLLYMGMEYLRTNHLVLAQHFLTAALQSSGGDPLCLHELGVAAWNKKDYEAAIVYFGRALRTSVETSRQTQVAGGGKLLPPSSIGSASCSEDSHPTSTAECIDLCRDDFWEPTLSNMGQCYRKMRHFEKAAHCFEKCLMLCPGKASSYAALGFTRHLTGDLDGAVELYHQALSRKPDDPFCSKMLNRALQESLSAIRLDDNGPPKANSSILSSRNGQALLSPPACGMLHSSFLSPDGISTGNHSDILRSGGGSNSQRRYNGGRDNSMATNGSNISLASGDIDTSMG